MGTRPPPGGDYATVSAAEGVRLVAEAGALVLDVRTPEEYTALGHVPGAWLLPVDLVAAGPAVLPDDGRPILVCCEHGIRSRHAADILARAGVPNVLNLAGGMSVWGGPRSHEPAAIAGPAAWLLDNADLLPRGGANPRRGRLRDTAERLGLSLQAEVRDLEDPEHGPADLGTEAFDLILVFRYLHRPLFDPLLRALAPGGLLLYETFTRAQASRGHPRNPDFLLEPGELPARLASLEILRSREGEFEGTMAASVAGRKRTG
jgi:rhodanese-related sulfurtransferase